jgi:flagellar motor component MotA
MVKGKDDNEFWGIIHEIRDLAEERMTAKERRKFKVAKSVAMGGKVTPTVGS